MEQNQDKKHENDPMEATVSNRLNKQISVSQITMIYSLNTVNLVANMALQKCKPTPIANAKVNG